MAFISQIIFLSVFGGLAYFGLQETGTINENAKKGLIAGIIVYITHGFIRRNNGPYIRGNETLWRGSLRLVHIYLFAIIFILFQKTDDARQMMKFLHPSLGKIITKEYHTYEEQCDININNILDNFDHYYLIHVINWFAAALIVRDYYILHFWSILDELIELSWQHILPHFGECWWDHIFHDVLLSNTVAIVLGVSVTRYLGWKQFDWLGRKDKKGFFSWEIFKCHRRFSAMMLIVCIIISNFLTGFFIINGLWIPPVMWMNPVRLLCWFLLANVAFGEIYDDIDTWNKPIRKTEKIGWEFRWLCVAVAFVEVLISWKFRNGTGNLTDAPTPFYIWGPWAISAGICVLIYLILRFKSNATTEFGNEKGASNSVKQVINKEQKETKTNENKKKKNKRD